VALPLPSWFAPSFAFVFGALWGSFLNVVIVRLPRDESIVFPASHCVACGAKIRPYDNIPIFSYLILQGRCRACGAAFSPRYALVELISAMAAWGCVQAFGLSWAALGFYVFLALLLVIACIDVEHWIIPHELSWSGIAVGLLFSFVNPRARPLDAILGAGLAWAGFTLLSWLGEKIFKKEALGLGDRWLLAMESAFLGYTAILPLVLLSSIQGTIFGLALIALGKSETGERPEKEPAAAEPKVPETLGEVAKDPSKEEAEEDEEEDWVPPKHALPFGPFLALAGVEILFFGPQLLQWYERTIARLLVR
jgi:leader peptidase (prepilin peptidase)/N-methyltransferase